MKREVPVVEYRAQGNYGVTFDSDALTNSPLFSCPMKWKFVGEKVNRWAGCGGLSMDKEIVH